MSEEREAEAVVPFELRYSLSRWQRLVLHVQEWDVLCFMIPLVEAIFLVGLVTNYWPGVVAVVWAWAFRGLFLGFYNVARYRFVPVDLRVEANGLGVLVGVGPERVWLFLDGLIGIDPTPPGLWTLRHFNGATLHIPADAITDAQLTYLRAAMERGHTPEGVRAVIERGRQLNAMERDE